jgi:hypothetical protein
MFELCNSIFLNSNTNPFGARFQNMLQKFSTFKQHFLVSHMDYMS